MTVTTTATTTEGSNGSGGRGDGVIVTNGSNAAVSEAVENRGRQKGEQLTRTVETETKDANSNDGDSKSVDCSSRAKAEDFDMWPDDRCRKTSSSIDGKREERPDVSMEATECDVHPARQQ